MCYNSKIGDKMKNLITISIILAFLLNYHSFSNEFTLEAYIDSYSAIDCDQSGFHDDNFDYFRSFSTVNGRENELGLNIAQLSGKVNAEHYYGALTLQYGDIPQQAWGGSAPVIQEAYAGIKLNERISFDAGYFTTHIGGELLLPKDNYLSSHSLATFIEPYYHAGIRANFHITEEFMATVSVLNGLWVFQDNNENKTLGLNLIYETEKAHLKYSAAFGNERPGAPQLAQFETYNDLSVELKIIENLSVKGQVDYHFLAAHKDSDENDKAIIAFAAEGKYYFAKKWAGTVRFAYIDNHDELDEHVPASTGLGYTAGIEFAPYKNSYVRLEGRILEFQVDDDEDMPFIHCDGPRKSRMELMLNFGVFFDLLSSRN
jgi:hypothetical protein